MKALTVAAQAEADRLFPQGGAVRARVGGGVTNAIALNETMVHGKTINLIQISILVLVIASLLLRSIAGGLLVLLPLATAALVNLGLMGWGGILLSMGTAAISAMAIGIGADYEIYLLFRFREELRRTGSVRQATRTSLLTSGKAIIFVALSVLGGYAVLQVSTFAFYNTLSNLVAATMFISAFIALFFLRALMMMFKPRFIFGDTPEKFFEKSEVLAGGGA